MLEQAVDEFVKQMKACAEARVDILSIRSEYRIWCFADIIWYLCNI